MSQLQFCSLCKNLLKHQIKDDGLTMQCHICQNLERVKNLTVYSETYRTEEVHEYPIHADLVLDQTLARTLKMKCPNPDCPSKTEAISPEVVLTHVTSDYLLGFICTVCKSFWKYDQQSPDEIQKDEKKEEDEEDEEQIEDDQKGEQIGEDQIEEEQIEESVTEEQFGDQIGEDQKGESVTEEQIEDQIEEQIENEEDQIENEEEQIGGTQIEQEVKPKAPIVVKKAKIPPPSIKRKIV